MHSYAEHDWMYKCIGEWILSIRKCMSRVPVDRICEVIPLERSTLAEIQNAIPISIRKQLSLQSLRPEAPFKTWACMFLSAAFCPEW